MAEPEFHRGLVLWGSSFLHLRVPTETGLGLEREMRRGHFSACQR